MARKVYHVVPNGNMWEVKLEGSTTPISRHSTKAAAVEAGKTVATNQPSQLKVHKEDGTFDYEHTYGDDPYPPRG